MISLALDQLPSPPLEAISICDQLITKIHYTIKHNKGWIGFDDYMKLALYEPGLGYYAAGSMKFGDQGDFVTAPEISPLFSTTLASQCREILATIPGGAILEFGPGSGQMACDILLALEAQNALPSHYYLVELSADLQQRQATLFEQHIPHLKPRITWLNQLDELDFNGVILANEVLDAMPVKRFQKLDDVISELGVSIHQHQLNTESQPLTPPSEQLLNTIEQQYGPLPNQYNTEINLLAGYWLKSIGHIIKQGVIIIIDYGYRGHEFYHPQRSSGTLNCHYRHFAHPDPFFYPGLQDITSHIDFSYIAAEASKADLTLCGYTTQAHFLMNCGILDLIPTALPPHEQLSLAQQIKKLTLPTEMGEIFKVMALSKDYEPALTGFQQMDFSHTL